jgi:hypothetical protein
MDKVLTRKLFKDVYLKSINKDVEHFKEGGLASLRAKHYQLGGLSEGEKTAMLIAPLASQLLTGTRQPGQSELGAVASNLGAALPQVTKTRLYIDKAENERLDQLAKIAKAQEVKPGFTAATEEEKKRLEAAPGDSVLVKRDPRDPTNILEYKFESKQEDRIEKIRKAVNDSKQLNTLTTLEKVEDLISGKYTSKGKNIPGIGPVGQLNIYGDDAKEVQSTLASLQNIVLKDRSGAAVTVPEFDRLKQELSTRFYNTDADLIKSLIRFREIANQHVASQLGGFRKEDVDIYTKSGGVDLRPSPFLTAKTKPQTGVEKRTEGRKTLSISDLKKIAGE